MPGPIWATRSPSTSTAAWLTRWTSALTSVLLMKMSLISDLLPSRARALPAALRPARAVRDPDSRGARRPARHLDRPARPRFLLARGRHRRLPRPRPRRRARLRRAARRLRRRGALRAGSALLGRREEEATDSAVAIVLVGCLAAGAILASDVFGSGANVETLLFGSLLLIDGSDLVLAGVAAGLTWSSRCCSGSAGSRSASTRPRRRRGRAAGSTWRSSA